LRLGGKYFCGDYLMDLVFWYSLKEGEMEMSVHIWSPDSYRGAWLFAAEVHHGQQVPGTQLPYIVHVGMVAMEVTTALVQGNHVDHPDLAVQCALLHDVIEDTGVSYSLLAERFGRAVADGVQALTKDSGLPKSAQMADSLARIQAQPKEIWMVKLADRIANLQPPPPHWNDERIAAYRQEAHQILQRLGSADAYLAARLQTKIQEY
jgi:(p)ppGpp synthase/HD superfamily hydrolase